jgi:hypothetical protein
LIRARTRSWCHPKHGDPRSTTYRRPVPHTLRFVIPDGSSSVLLVEDGSGWSLPNVSSDEPEIVVGAAPALRDLVGQDVVVLRDVRFGPMPPPEDAVFYLTEPVRDPHAAKGRWWTRTDLRGLDLVEPRDRSALDTWFREEAPGSLQPWQREGWFGTAVAWIDGVLPGVSEVRQFATWCNSCVLRVTSTRGRSWFKAVPTFWASEPAVTAMLAELFPGRTPQVLALESERRWMLLDDLGGEPADLLPVHERMGAPSRVTFAHRSRPRPLDMASCYRTVSARGGTHVAPRGHEAHTPASRRPVRPSALACRPSGARSGPRRSHRSAGS